jgi:glycosyltransferase involved in cell wall biosynthesis
VEDVSAQAIDAQLQAQRQWIDSVEAQAARLRILSTLPYRKVPFWVRVVDTVAARRGRLGGLLRRAGITDLTLIFRLLVRAHRYDLVLLTGGERVDMVYAAVASLCPWVRTPHVIVDAHWQRADGLAHRLQRLLLAASRRLVVQVQPHSVEEVSLYATHFGIPPQRQWTVPWSTSLLGYDLPEPSDDEAFILTGGFSFRDYDLFIEAAGRAGVPVKIGVPAAQVDDAFRAIVKRHPNVTLHTDWSNAQYLEQMARCRVFAMPIQQGLSRSTGDQALLNAMYFGKVVVASDSIGPRIYLRDGENGFLVREASVDAWVRALLSAFTLDRAAYRRLGAHAAFDARVHFNEPLRLARILEAAMTVCATDPLKKS